MSSSTGAAARKASEIYIEELNYLASGQELGGRGVVFFQAEGLAKAVVPFLSPLYREPACRYHI